jgi:polysaccharide pyruvyl transferase WcaK-like protein
MTHSSRNSKHPLRVLIVEAYTDANIGSCALVENSLKIIESKFKKAEIRVMAHYPQAFTDLYDKPAINDIFQYPFKQPRFRQISWLLKTLCWMLGTFIVSRRLRHKSASSVGCSRFCEKISPFLWADLVVSVGAERLNDNFYKNIVFSLYTYYLCKSYKKKMVLFPSTIGPFFFWWSKLLTKKVLSKVDLVYTRDQASTRVLYNELKIPSEKILNSVDVAVLQVPISKKQAHLMIRANEDEILVGISAMRWTYFKNRIELPYSNYDAYVHEMAITADSLISQYNLTIVFYPTNYPIHASREDDLSTAYDISSLITNKKKTKIITKLPTPSQLQGMLACSQVNITTRMHACILSTSACVPTISINYLFKVREYMDSLGLSDFSIDIEEFCAAWTLKAFSKIWSEREQWRTHLENVIDQKRRLLWQSMEPLDALV